MPLVFLNDFHQPHNIFHEVFNPEEHYDRFHRGRLPWGPWGTPLLNRRQVVTPSEQNNSADDFHVNLDVQQFRREEIAVKVSGENEITVEGKHEERQDEHGFVSRQFVRRFTVPEGFDINSVETRLSSDGVLRITAPKIKAGKKLEEREIPIVQTGQPSKVAENKPIETGQDEKKEE